MQKTIIFGTDLHGDPSEHAAKLARDLFLEIPNSKILSIQNRKSFVKKKNVSVIPSIFSNNHLRKIIQGFLLPIYLLFSRITSNRILSFWTINGKYHSFIIRYIKFLRYDHYFTIISGYEKDYSVLKFCDAIICQSDKMADYIKYKIPDNKIRVIYPWTNLNMFKPAKKDTIIFIPSVPYKIHDFKERGMDLIIKLLKELQLSSKIIFRSQESYDYFKKLDIKNLKLINQILTDSELTSHMGKAKIIPLIYGLNAPDMPLSAIEGLASGCAIICTDKMGIEEIIKKEKSGIIANNYLELKNAVNIIMKDKSYNQNARRTAEKHFDKKINLKKYLELIR